MLILQNFVSEEYQNYLESLVTSSQFPLFFNKDTALGEGSLINNNVISAPQFTHTFIVGKKPNSDFCGLLDEIIKNMEKQTDLTSGLTIERVKLNLNTQHQKTLSTSYYAPHVDVTNAKGVTGVYYVSNSDGDTLFFSEGKITNRVTPKKGTMILFDNKVFHSGQPPKKSKYRCLINFNWVV